jgi:hypothetical protein
LAGVFKGAARRVSIKTGLPTGPVPDPLDLNGPLHDPRKKTITRTENPHKFLSVREYNLTKIDLRSGLKLAFPLGSKHDFHFVLQRLVKVSV